MGIIRSERKLPPLQQEFGIRVYLWFTRINAFSFGCLADSMLILYAIKNGADDFLVGLLTSFFFITMPLMFLGKQLVAKRGAAFTYSISWMLRNISAALMIAVPLVSRTFGNKSGLALLAVGAFGFFGFRSMGLTANTPLIGEITNKSNRGHFISKIWLHFNIFYLITMLGIIFILRHHESLTTFQGIIAFGSITGLLSSALIYRVPETENTKISGNQPIGRSILYIWRNNRPRKLLFAWSATVVIVMLVNPFSMVALKNGYQVSDYHALFFALFQILGGIISSVVNGMLLDRVGPRPMLIMYSFGLLIASLMWVVTPSGFVNYYTLTVFLITGICRAGAMTAVAHYFLTIIPGEERVGANMFMYMTSGVIGGLSGSFIGGGLLKFIPTFNINGLDIYRTYFFIILFVLIPMFFIIRKVERVADWHIKDVLGIFVSLRDIRALFTLNKLEREINLAEEYANLEKLRESPSELSEKRLLTYLNSPRFQIRGKALGALGQINFSNKTAAALIKEVQRGEFTTAYIAAEILGEHHITEAIPILRKSLNSEDVYLQGKSMLALAQLRDEASYPLIEQLFINSTNPRIIIHGARAIVQMNDLHRLRLLLEKAIAVDIPQQVREELLYSICEMCHCEEEFYRSFKVYKIDRQSGFSAFQEIIYNFAKKSTNSFDDIIKLTELIKNEDKTEIIESLKIVVTTANSLISLAVRELLNHYQPHQFYETLLFVLILILAKEKVTKGENKNS